MKALIKMLLVAGLSGATLPLTALTPGEPPLPKVDEVLHRVLKRVDKEGENDRQFNAQYIYSRTKVTETRNGSGELKKKEEDTREHNPNVVRTGARARANQQARERAAAKMNSDTNRVQALHGPAFDKGDFPLDDDLLNRFQFTLVGRELINGRPTLILDFVPAGGDQPERNIKDRFINKAAGRAWVDEAEAALVKADIYLSEKVSVAAGLVGSIWKFNFKFNRERLADGLWFTKTSGWHLEGREFLFRKIIDFQEERNDVRPARPTSPATSK